MSRYTFANQASKWRQRQQQRAPWQVDEKHMNQLAQVGEMEVRV